MNRERIDINAEKNGMFNRTAASIVAVLMLRAMTGMAQQAENVRAAAAPDASRTEGWPAFRGPHRDGVSLETDWTAEWPATGPTKVWQATLANDFSGLSIQDGRIYTMGTQNRTAQTKAYCLDAATGKAQS
jgi:hypothetical protein